MQNMSFSLTTEQMRARAKTVTRRWAWQNLKPGDVIMAVEQRMGLKRGEKIKRLHPIRIISVDREPVGRLLELRPRVQRAELIREGFPHMDPHEFVDMLCKMQRPPRRREDMITRIEFVHLAEDEQC